MEKAPQTIRIEHAEADKVINAIKNLQDALAPKEPWWRRAFKALFSWLFQVAIPVVALVGGYWLNSAEDRVKEEQHQIDEALNQRLETMISISTSLEKAITNYRMSAQEIILSCEIKGSQKRELEYENSKQRIESEYEVAKAAAYLKYYFSASIDTKGKEFLAWIASLPNFCNEGSASLDSEILQKEIALTGAIEKSIRDLQGETSKRK